jgi:membrane associated rhomboid family serine protease
MRGPSFGSQRSATVLLLVVNTAVFVLQSILSYWQPATYGTFFNLCALSQTGLAHGYVWQLITYQFMHGGMLHLLLNMVLVFFFGRAIEDALGSKSVFRIYLLSGTIGGLVQVLYQVVMQRVAGDHVTAVVGASAAGLGLLAAYATLFPHREITLLLFFFIPISMRARTLLLISTGLALFGMLAPMSNVAEAAHLGGILTGVAYIHCIVQGVGWPSLARFRPARGRPRVLVSAPLPKRSFWQRSRVNESEDLPPAEFISREVDPILDKISASGIQSLTERERRILEAARAKMAKR